MGVSEMRVSEMGVSGMGVSGMGVSEMGVSGMGVSGMGVSEMGVSEMGVSGMGVSGMGVSEMGVSGMGVSEYIMLAIPAASVTGLPSYIQHAHFNYSTRGPLIRTPLIIYVTTIIYRHGTLKVVVAVIIICTFTRGNFLNIVHLEILLGGFKGCSVDHTHSDAEVAGGYPLVADVEAVCGRQQPIRSQQCPTT